MANKLAIKLEDLVIEGQEEFLIHRRLFTDPQIFELELERIFYRTWVYVAHESEVVQGGDYKATHIGRQPVIVTRDADDGRVYVLYNRCRHRGATVCQDEYGNASYFRCAYHGWTYRNRGDLVSVPMREGYGPRFDPSQLGLVRVPRVASYRGFIFASLSSQGPTLEDQMGNARLYLDLLASLGPFELGKLGIHKVGYDGNWKLQMDNNTDSYHVPLLHKSWRQLLEQRAGPQPMSGARMRGLGQGHGTMEMEADKDPLEAGYDPLQAPWRPWQMSLFPNLSFIAFPFYTLQVRIVRPIAVNRTEVWHYPFLIPGEDEEKKTFRFRTYEMFYGPAGVGNPDDREMFERVQMGLQCQAVDWLVLSRSLHLETTDQRGIQTDPHAGESGQRSFYREWKRLMTGE